MTRRFPAPEENRLLALLRRCSECQVLTYTKDFPEAVRPAFGRRYGGNGLCCVCLGRARRGTTHRSDRRRPCPRCGIARTRSLDRDGLCIDCAEVVAAEVAS